METSDIISMIISIVALIGSFLAWLHNIWTNRKTRIIVLRSSWDQVRPFRKSFWQIARSTYSSFLNDKSNWSNELNELIHSAGMPPNVPVKKSAQIKNWYDDNLKTLNEDQKKLWEFVSAIYPKTLPVTADLLRNSIILDDHRNVFDDSRRQLATFFHRQRELMSNSKLYNDVGHAVLDIILLSWLELALVRSTGDERPGKKGYKGKWGLYDFGNYLQKK